jgi:8-oxo-dGTP diphosphatase
MELPLWEGDRYFLPLVFDRQAPAFHGVMPYADGRPTGWNFRSLRQVPGYARVSEVRPAT